MNGDANWVRKLAEWQGGINATIKGLARNQDEIEKRLQAIWDSHAACREQVLTTLATLEANAANEGRRQGLITGAIVSIIVGAVITMVNVLIG